MIEALLPPAAVPVEAFSDLPGESPYPGEEDLVARAVETRRREFVTARRCAREALARLGYAPAPIRSGPRREPVWPAGVVGSITHCAGYRAAAVGRITELASLGIDAEPHGRLPDGVGALVTVAGEPDLLGRLADADPGVHWDRLLFSAKESVYKAWYPLTGRWLGFEDAELSVDPAAGTFTARLLVDGRRTDGGPELTELRGRYLVARGLVVTAVAVAR
ncbi:4'-phosphopantetheinyl transferase superfamily protein [Micromonospora sp. NPDC047738]|uniref:4'-phosphopantetheinyl transferase family protein n=1 Tax=unclassified Micromonospora TaxID=2617518 RepID=UPI0034000C3F